MSRIMYTNSLEDEHFDTLVQVKGNVTECNSYRGIKLMCHGMKLNERLVEYRLRQVI